MTSAACYQQSLYKWTIFILLIACGISAAVLLLLDMTTKVCNDQYHDINECLESTNCEERYCEPTPCSNYTCLPRVRDWCILDNMYYYPDDICPQDKKYKTAYVVFGILCGAVVIILVHIITMCHYRFVQHPYTRLNKSLESDENYTTCSECGGIGNDIMTNRMCSLCQGKGKMYTS